MDKHSELSLDYGDVTFAERHLPYSKFRKNVSDLQTDTSELLNDTLVNFSYAPFFDLNLITPIVIQTTTVPYLIDKRSSPENPRRAMERPSSSESPDAVSTPSTPSPGASADASSGSSKLPAISLFNRCLTDAHKPPHCLMRTVRYDNGSIFDDYLVLTDCALLLCVTLWT